MEKMSGIMILKSNSREWLQEAISAGLLNGEAMRRVTHVLEENEVLRRENAFLNGRIAALEAVRDDYRAVHFQAFQYKYNCERGYKANRTFRWSIGFALVCVTAAVLCLAFNLVWFGV